MYTDIPNHEPSMFMMNSGHVQALRPSYGSWLRGRRGCVGDAAPPAAVTAAQAKAKLLKQRFVVLFKPLARRFQQPTWEDRDF